MHASRVAALAAATALVVGFAGPAVAQAATPSSAAPVSVVVREHPGSGHLAERVVRSLGGSVQRELGLINGFSATVPADRLGVLRATAGVAEVTENAALTLDDADVSGQASQPGSLYTLANKVTGASALWDAGATGKGVDIALIDSGVVQVNGLTTPGKIVYGPDLTQESGTQTQNLDTFGHGTNMAGIIAGRDNAAPSTATSGNSSDFLGMAPDARIVSIKIADAQGRTDVSQALAAIDWVVQNRNRNGLNIRVLNMSFGTDSTQSYLLDPLTYAVETAWHSGVVVVASVGNSGNGTLRVNDPASDPYVIAVGSANTNGTATRADDAVSTFSNSGDGKRNPDVVAPGEHVVSLRDPGSFLGSTYPNARVGSQLFRGSGTSQATAAVSGAAALLLSQRPNLTPDQVKALLTATAKPLPSAPVTLQGRGLIDLAAARTAATPLAVQAYGRASGTGSLEAARGSVHVSINGVDVKGEIDVRGQAFDSSRWAAQARSGNSWDGLSWSGLSWSGLSWSGLSWSGADWA